MAAQAAQVGEEIRFDPAVQVAEDAPEPAAEGTEPDGSEPAKRAVFPWVEPEAGEGNHSSFIPGGTPDAINPSHYQGFSNGAEVIDITENLNFNRGNCVKYAARAGAKNPDTLLEDLRKAKWYLEREIARVERAAK
ncbi:MAG: DUF3310 domain-containing protein [Comamonadaceae bacterium]|nr:MAG: DUF3310 domain-containing protein [Comamonadaceae bacterium]